MGQHIQQWTKQNLWKTALKKFEVIKGTLSGLRQFLATESSLKIMKNTFCFTSKAISVLRIFKFFS